MVLDDLLVEFTGVHPKLVSKTGALLADEESEVRLADLVVEERRPDLEPRVAKRLDGQERLVVVRFVRDRLEPRAVETPPEVIVRAVGAAVRIAQCGHRSGCSGVSRWWVCPCAFGSGLRAAGTWCQLRASIAGARRCARPVRSIS